MKGLYTCSLVAIVFVTVFFFEFISTGPHKELRPATVLEVTEDRRGYLGYDDTTWIIFDDGYPDSIPGICGKPGDKIRAWRSLGTKSWLGLVGDITGKESAKLRNDSQASGFCDKLEIME